MTNEAESIVPTRRIRSVGTVGALIEASSGSEAQFLASWVAGHVLRDQLTEVIPGARTLYIAGPSDVVRLIASEAAVTDAIDSTLEQVPSPRTMWIDVRYDGPDLHESAERLNMSSAELVEMHTSTEYLVQFFGFSPGQAFFAELPPQLRLPRRPSPRLRVPMGAVAIANEFTVIYPRQSPGGWNLLGTRVSQPLWDPSANPPNLVAVGDRIRFRAVR